MVDRLLGLLVGRAVSWWVGWVAGWLVGWVVGWLLGPFRQAICWSVGAYVLLVSLAATEAVILLQQDARPHVRCAFVVDVMKLGDTVPVEIVEGLFQNPVAP